MEYIAKQRVAGKSHELITKYFIGSDKILIVCNESERKRIINEYRLSRGDSNRIISWYNAKEKLDGIKNPVLIDNVDMLIAEIIGRFPDVITFSGTEAC